MSVRVLDFGLARVDDAETLTAAGDVPGTLAYIAPERLDGEDASGAADVWSVGVLLWEALAGWHPFSAISPVETARRIAAGAPPLAKSRPDLPRELCATVDRMLAVDPRRRPAAKRLPGELRSALEERARRPRTVSSPRVLRERVLPATLAGAFGAGTAFFLPFFPRGSIVVLGILAALAALRSPRGGLALALAVPVLPLGNISLGLALAYLPVAAGWLLLFARDATNGLLFIAGPLLAPVGALALLPALVLRARGTARRACQAAAGVLAAIPVLASDTSPSALGVAGVERPDDAVRALTEFLGAHPALALEALVFSAAAGAARFACARGFWGVAAWGSAFLGAAVLLPPALGTGRVDALSLTVGVWVATGILGARVVRSGH